MSLPEVLLWNLLRKAPEGVVFRRQVSFGEHLVVDFYCAKAKLCIEIDGIAHDMGTTRKSTTGEMPPSGDWDSK